jgi:hypothetical protein
MLPADRYNLVDGPNIDFCTFCNARKERPDLVFVSIDAPPSEDTIPGTVEAIDNSQPGVRASRVRDGTGSGEGKMIIERMPMMCSDCIGQAADRIGLGDRAPLLAEIDELRQERDGVAAALEESELHRQEAEAALRGTAVYERMLNAGQSNGGAQPARRG